MSPCFQINVFLKYLIFLVKFMYAMIMNYKQTSITYNTKVVTFNLRELCSNKTAILIGVQLLHIYITGHKLAELNTKQVLFIMSM